MVLDGLFDMDLREVGTEFDIPVVMLMGRADLHTPYETARAYFDEITAPHNLSPAWAGTGLDRA